MTPVMDVADAHGDHSIDAAAHRAHRGLDPVSIGVRARDQQMKSLLLRRVVHAANHLGEKLAVQIGEKHADRFGLARDQAARDAVGRVTQPRRDLANPLPRLLTDGSAFVEHAGHGRHRHARFSSDVFYRCHGV